MIVAGRFIEAERFGPLTGPTLVFLHEGLGSLGLWRDFPRRLSEACGLGGFVYSRAGYGASDPAPLPRPVTYMHDEAALLPLVLREAGITEPVLIGHSDGASIALIHGGPARALVLLAPHVFTEEAGLQSIARMREQYDSGGPLRARLARWHQHVDAAFRGWNDAWLHPDFRAWNLEEFLPRITAPVLLIQGRDDEYGSTKQLDAICRGVRAPCHIELLENCGHSPHRDQPDQTLRLIQTFIGDSGTPYVIPA